jgi:hypothetical protein
MLFSPPASVRILPRNTGNKKPLTVSSQGFGIGGGGGTACSISFETGWTIPSPAVAGRGERVVDRCPLASNHPSTPWSVGFRCANPTYDYNSLGAYESLAGLRVSPSPDGVGIGPLSISVHRMSSLFQRGSLPVATIVLIDRFAWSETGRTQCARRAVAMDGYRQPA